MSAPEPQHPPTLSSDHGSVTIGKNTGQVNVDNTFHVAAPLVVSWPIRVGSIPPLAAAFQPRAATRARIEAAWSASASGPVVLAQTVIGDGGVGKSQLAAAIADDAISAGVDLVVWVPASSRDQVVAVYADAARRVQAPGRDTADADLAARAFLDWAATTTRSWLVVLDDATLSGAELKDLWPASPGGTGRVLVTTRERSAAGAGTRVDLGVFTPDEAETYLRQRIADHPDPTAAGVLDDSAELSADLGYLPVALAQAIAVILNDGITTRAYRDRFADRDLTLTDLFPPDADADGYARTIATTWLLALEHATRLSPIARPVAELVALLDPAGAPGALIETDAARTYLAAHTPTPSADESTQITDAAPQEVRVSADQARLGLRALHRLSVIIHDPGGGVQAIRIHALAQRAITDTTDPGRLAIAVRAVADALLEIWPEPERDTNLGAILRANTTHLHSTYPNGLWGPGGNRVHPVLFKTIASLGETGQVATSARAAEDLYVETLEELGPNHPDTLTTRGNLAGYRGRAGDPAGAIAAFKELLLDQIRILGLDHPDTLMTRNNLAGYRSEAGDSAGAVTDYENLLPDRVRILGPDHPDTLMTRGNLAHVRGRAGDPAGAIAEYEELLVDQERVLGLDHPSTLMTRHNLASWRGLAGDPAGAVTALEELLPDRVRVLGASHPDTLLTRSNLASWRGRTGDPAGAVAGYRDLLPDRLRILGPDHPSTLITRHQLAIWRGRAGDPAGAAAALEELLLDRVRILDSDHPDTLRTRRDLAYWLGRQ